MSIPRRLHAVEIVYCEELLLLFPDPVDSCVVRHPCLGKLVAELLDDQLVGVELVPVSLVRHADEIPLFRCELPPNLTHPAICNTPMFPYLKY